jgi:hypothetical protein
MNKTLLWMRQALLLTLLLPTLALAGPLLQTITGIAVQQTGGPFITDLGNGISRWVTPLRWTNNNAFATNDLYFVATSQWVNGQPVDATAMQWDDAAGVFRKGNLVGEADNEAFFVELADTNIPLPSPVFGISPSDSLAAFFIGSLLPGQFVDTQVNFLMTTGVGPMWFNGAIVQQVGEPHSAALAVLALLGLFAARRGAAGPGAARLP